TFTDSLDTPRAATGLTCHTMRRVGFGADTGCSTTRPGIAAAMPVMTTSWNSASVRFGNGSRMLTLAVPAGVITSKSGVMATVYGEPVHPTVASTDASANPAMNVLGLMLSSVTLDQQAAHAPAGQQRGRCR